MSDLHFDAETHTYTLDGVEIPCVTDVLNDLIPGYKAGQWYLDRGTAVHACAALIAQGVEFEHDPAIDGQVLALRRFFREMNPTVIAVEKPMVSAMYRFAGTCDLIIEYGGSRHLKKAILDWKASLSKAVPYQLGAYGILADVDYGCAVEIRADGTYQMTKVIPLRLYKTKFLNLLSAYNIRRECGVKVDAGDDTERGVS